MTDVSDLTLEEKAGITSGASFWYTKPIESAGVPSIMLTDGPHGLRKQPGTGDHLGLDQSVPATCFPPAVGIGSSWDTELLHRVGVALGQEASIEDVGVLLGPGMNIKRSPLCGRNFEYLSEDPIVSGNLAAAYVKGVQSQGVGTSPKHFAANNQEADRQTSSSDVDERTLREIYLRGFHRVVQDSSPWTIMCSYNKINGVQASQDPWLLTEVLRNEWGYDGVMLSDWGAVVERVPALAAGLDLEMPSTGGRTDAQIVEAVKDGSLDESLLDTSAQRVLDLIQRAVDGKGKVAGPLDVDAHHALAREAAGRSIVLLRNEGSLLPLDPATNIAVIGEFAEKPRYQGAGSSLINPTKLENAIDAIREVAPSTTYSQGFTLAANPEADEVTKLRDEAVAVAKEAQTVVLFLGLPARLESEGYDRTDIDLPADQLELLDAILEVNSNVVVVLSNGGVVALPFADQVPAILEAWLLGQAGGSATADVLFGRVNPSAKLTETIPIRLEDNPSYLNFPGTFLHTLYGEGIFVGYRWYDAKGLAVTYPFGHGLSYTTFDYADATAEIGEDGEVKVAVNVTNTGDRTGREIVQVYTGIDNSVVPRPVRELKAFASVELDPGETSTVVMTIPREDLAYWDARVPGWVVEPGTYRIEVAASSRDIRQSLSLEVEGDRVVLPLTRESSLAEALAHPVAGPIIQHSLDQMMETLGAMDAVMPEGVDITAMIGSMPIGRLGTLGGDSVSPEAIDQLIAMANAGEEA